MTTLTKEEREALQAKMDNLFKDFYQSKGYNPEAAMFLMGDNNNIQGFFSDVASDIAQKTGLDAAEYVGILLGFVLEATTTGITNEEPRSRQYTQEEIDAQARDSVIVQNNLERGREAFRLSRAWRTENKAEIQQLIDNPPPQQRQQGGLGGLLAALMGGGVELKDPSPYDGDDDDGGQTVEEAYPAEGVLDVDEDEAEGVAEMATVDTVDPGSEEGDPA